MRKAKREEAPGATPAEEPGENAFQPTPVQRAFVSAAAGPGVPRRVICRMLPGAEPGATVSISAHMLRNYFSLERREGSQRREARRQPYHPLASPIISPNHPRISHYLPLSPVISMSPNRRTPSSAAGDLIGL
jgi:hypothetical protein